MSFRIYLALILIFAMFSAAVAQPSLPLVGDEPLPAGVRFVPGPYNHGRDDADLVGE